MEIELKKDMRALRLKAKAQVKMEYERRQQQASFALVYARKRKLADEYLAGLIDCPYLIEAEARTRGIGQDEMARLIVQKSEKATRAEDDIELLRMEANYKIDSATTEEEIDSVVSHFKHLLEA